MKVKDIQIGERIVFGTHEGEDIVWRKVSDENDFFAETECGYRPFDVSEPDSTSRARRRHGNNFFPHSNIFNWLNSCNMDWYAQTHEFDRRPFYATSPGFLWWFTPEEINAMLPMDYEVSVPLGSRKEFGKRHPMRSLVTLPSATQIGAVRYPEEAEGSQLVDLTEYLRSNYRFSVMTRTGVLDASQLYCFRRGLMDTCQADDSVAVHPMIRLTGELTVSDQADMDGLRYTFVQDSREHLDDFYRLIS